MFNNFTVDAVMKPYQWIAQITLVWMHLVSVAAYANTSCEGVHDNLFSELQILPTFKINSKSNIENVASFESAYSELAPQYAKEGLYMRRPTKAEVDLALQSRSFNRDPYVMDGMFVVQKGKLDFNKIEKVQIAYSSKNPNSKKWNENFDFVGTEKAMRTLLEKGEIVSEMTIEQYRNHLAAEGGKFSVGMKADRIKFITLKNGMQGVFKAISLQQAVAEVAAYKLARLLGIDLVPPTVIAKHNGLIGSFQYLVESPASGINSAFEAKRTERVSARDAALREIYYIISGNWDAHPGNQIVQRNGGLGLIDNEAITRPQFYRYGEIPWIPLYQLGKLNKTEFEVPWTTGFPFDQAKIFHKPTFDNVLSVIGNKPYDHAQLIEKLKWYQNDTANIGLIEWNNTLWARLDIFPYYYPRQPQFFPVQTMKIVQNLTTSDLKGVLQKPFEDIGGQNVFTEADVVRMKQRIEALLSAWR